MRRRPNPLRTRLVAAATALAALTATVAIATTAALGGNAGRPEAIPTGDTLIVFAYYSDPAKTHLIGQSWSGCGQPAGSWGTTSPYRNLFFTPC